MGRSPRDFESRASTSFTTPALGGCSGCRGGTFLFYHIFVRLSRSLFSLLARRA
jgi:hypothetical protein